MSPSSSAPSGMRTFTSRSTTTSYFRSDVDHVRVNIFDLLDEIPITPGAEECLARQRSIQFREKSYRRAHGVARKRAGTGACPYVNASYKPNIPGGAVS